MLVKEKIIEEKVLCYHCGDQCIDSLIRIEDKNFCCHGCKTVFEILDENDLSIYYDLEANPGLKNNDLNHSKYDYLDTPAVAEKLLNYASDSLNKVTFYIPDIHCSSCIYLLEHLNKIDSKIFTSKINFSNKEVTIDFDPQGLSLKGLVIMLAHLGYAPEINLSTIYTKAAQNNDNFYLKLGVAGFCFGNVMLLSFPDYFGFEVEAQFQTYFTYLCMLLSLPVLFYSSSDYFYSAYIGFKKKHSNIEIPIVLGISTLFLRSLYEVITHTGYGYFDSLTGLVFFLLIGKWFQSKTYKSLSFDRDYTSYFPLAITRINKKNSESVLVNELEIGDKILVKNEEILPADAVLISESANLDYSFVTGESEPILKKKKEKIYAGGRVKGIAAIFQVIKPVSQNYLTQLWNNEVFDKKYTNQTQSLINRISKHFTLAIITIAVSAAIFWLFQDSTQAFFVFIAVLIVACPCALALATPFTLGSVLNALGGHKFYLKNTEVIENLWRINHIVFDKTGTITTNESDQMEYFGKSLSDPEKNHLKLLVQNSIHPISNMIESYLGNQTSDDLNDFTTPIDNYKEYTGQGIEGTIDGKAYKLGSAEFVEVENFDDKLPNGTKSYISINGLVMGAFVVKVNYRMHLKALIKNLKNKNNLSLLSGDNEKEKAFLSQIFPNKSNIHFDQKPESKLQHIKHLQDSGDEVMMIGDGLNDAGALKISNFGVAITDDMSAFTPASDAILQGDQLQYLDIFLRFVRKSKTVLKGALLLSFVYNVIGLSFAVTGNLTPIFAAILMPLSSITVVVFATLTINLLATRMLDKALKHQ